MSSAPVLFDSAISLFDALHRRVLVSAADGSMIAIPVVRDLDMAGTHSLSATIMLPV
jgi:hypothetical protein